MRLEAQVIHGERLSYSLAGPRTRTVMGQPFNPTSKMFLKLSKPCNVRRVMLAGLRRSSGGKFVPILLDNSVVTSGGAKK
jgi:hypothetical protein